MLLPWLVLLLLPQGAVDDARPPTPAHDAATPVAVAVAAAPEDNSSTPSESTTEPPSSQSSQPGVGLGPTPLVASTLTLPPVTEASTTVQPGVPAGMLIKPAEPRKPVFPKRTWWTLTAAQHGAAIFDAWSTRESITSGRGHELNPLMKPLPSQNPSIRRMWWLPQVAMTTTFIFSGAHNLRVARR